MNRKVILTGVAVAAIGAGVGFAGLQAAAPWVGSPAAIAGVAFAAQQGDAEGDGPGRGWRRGGRHHGGGFAMMCSPRRDERIGRMLETVEGMLILTPPQTEAWQALTATIEAGGERIDGLCAEFEQAGAPETAPERLARMERAMDAGLGVLREVRTSFDAFYGTLEPDQRKVIDGLAAMRGHHRRG